MAARVGTTWIYGQASGVYDHYFDTFLNTKDLAWSFFQTIAHLARALPESTEEESEDRCARRCQFCDTIFFFSPAQPTCVRCGAPPTRVQALQAFRAPPEKARTEAFMDTMERMLASAREPAARFAKHVPGATMTEHTDRGWIGAAVSVRYREGAYWVQVVYRATDVMLIVELPGVEGKFTLLYADDAFAAGASDTDTWDLRERPRYVSPRSFFESGDSHTELARFETLPLAARKALSTFCEEHEAMIDLVPKGTTRSLGTTTFLPFPRRREPCPNLYGLRR